MRGVSLQETPVSDTVSHRTLPPTALPLHLLAKSYSIDLGIGSQIPIKFYLIPFTVIKIMSIASLKVGDLIRN